MLKAVLLTALCTIIGYLFGSTTLAIFIGDVFYNRDVRNEGSGNMGATNMSRSFGMKAGVWTLLWDVGKCLIALIIGRAVFSEIGICAAGIACLIGHAFPCLHYFKGGKCVACSVAVAFFLSWKIGIIVLAVFALAVLLSRRVSLGSVLAALALAVSSVFLTGSVPEMVLGAFAGCFVILRHHANIRRLIKGTEPAFSISKEE